MTIELSIVIPVFNEGPILENLARRCAIAAEFTGKRFEILLVDDCSTDETRAIVAELNVPGLRVLHLPQNCGQFGATRSGLREARGSSVVVLDGDLQDPPEEIPRLVAAMGAARSDVVFAVKASRQDPGWMKLAVKAYNLVQRLGGRSWPSGAGSYCIMTADYAARVARLHLKEANLAAALLALGARAATMPYRRETRWDGTSHIGIPGLTREAIGSMALTGSLPRLLGAAAIVLGILGALAGGRRGRGLGVAAVVSGLGALGLHRHIGGAIDKANAGEDR